MGARRSGAGLAAAMCRAHRGEGGQPNAAARRLAAQREAHGGRDSLRIPLQEPASPHAPQQVLLSLSTGPSRQRRLHSLPSCNQRATTGRIAARR
eukprot:scaffold202079_cov37-Tisochrysis_lutea.AAC.2